MWQATFISIVWLRLSQRWNDIGTTWSSHRTEPTSRDFCLAEPLALCHDGLPRLRRCSPTLSNRGHQKCCTVTMWFVAWIMLNKSFIILLRFRKLFISFVGKKREKIVRLLCAADLLLWTMCSGGTAEIKTIQCVRRNDCDCGLLSLRLCFLSWVESSSGISCSSASSTNVSAAT